MISYINYGALHKYVHRGSYSVGKLALHFIAQRKLCFSSVVL